MNDAPKRSFHVLVSLPLWSMHIPKGILVPRGAGVSGQLVDIDKLQLEESTINVVHSKPGISRDTKISTVRDVERTDDQKILEEWEYSISIH